MREPSRQLPLWIAAPAGAADLALAEVAALGAVAPHLTAGGVRCHASLAQAYAICLGARVASRVVVPVGAAEEVHDGDALYRHTRALPWEAHLAPGATFAIEVKAANAAIDNSLWALQRCKDGIVDRLGAERGERPTVDRRAPDLRIALRLRAASARWGIDLAGPLHRRGARRDGGPAPLRETAAAVVLRRAGWPRSGPLVDPMCGSGTLLIEAAWMALDWDPGLGWAAEQVVARSAGWLGHDAERWGRVLAAARARRDAGWARRGALAISGRDEDPAMVRRARANLGRAGLAEVVSVEVGEVAARRPPAAPAAEAGTVITNPPHGERLGDHAALTGLYARLGSALRRHYPGWRAHVLAGDPALGRALGLRAHAVHSVANGPLRCCLVHLDIPPLAVTAAGPSAFARRLAKNYRHRRGWAQRRGTDCYRLYDADIPEYAVVVDLYGDHAHVQEYAAPPEISLGAQRRRLAEVLVAVPEVLGLPPAQVLLKTRQRQRGAAQYARHASAGAALQVREGGCRFWVNLSDYLDTGLFLDQRRLRDRLAHRAAGTTLLNLFAYTAAATVRAIAGGARRTVSVDSSRAYLDWAGRNLALNQMGGAAHELVRADCQDFLACCQQRFDRIFLGPPTFSNSRHRPGCFAIQRDHVELLRAAARLLQPGGELIFCSHARAFQLDRQALAELQVHDISAATVDEDTRRAGRHHHAYALCLPSPQRRTAAG